MAKIKYDESIPSALLSSFYADANPKLSGKSSTEVTIKTQDGERLILSGTNLEFKNNDIIAGTVTSVEFLSEKGKMLAHANELDFSASRFSDRIDSKDLSRAIEDFVFAGNDQITGTSGRDQLLGYDGNDTIFGGGGKDEISGGKGRDILNGGGATDVFYVGVRGQGDDTIEDFDYKGGNSDILAVDDEFKAVAKGNDTLVKFDNGSSVLLLDVSLKRFYDIDIVEM